MSIETRVAQLIRPEIRALQAYPVGDARGMIKLDAMENPFHWPAEMVSEWLQILSECAINRYPHPTAPEVIAGLRDAMKVPDQYDIVLGNGSDEIIQLLTMAVALPGATVLAPEPGFVMYKMIATYVGVNYVGVPLNEDFSLNRDAMLSAIKEHQPALIYLAQPNNPSGNLWDEDVLHAIIQASKGLVVLDEAYLPFSSRNHLSWLDKYEHVVVMRTLSKVGLAGLRLGMLFGRSEWLNEINKIRMPYNINVLTQASAAYALKHYRVLHDQCGVIKKERQIMQDKLRKLGFQVFDSEANFVLARVDAATLKCDARGIFEQLKNHKILIKCLDGAHPLLTQCLRFTVGSSAENKSLFQALEKILNALK
ncbi:MAG: histidinol-phosphate transaminase [Oleibacter sp.]|nr:histidinol-phosphate transaminase [Thalassolituus sp.]